jgi:hypothetical protein
VQSQHNAENDGFLIGSWQKNLTKQNFGAMINLLSKKVLGDTPGKNFE